MALISEIITAVDANKLASQYIDIEHEYVINSILRDIKKCALDGKSYIYYSYKWVNDWFWEDITSQYCYNYFTKLGYQISIEDNRYKLNDKIYMIRW